MVQANGRVDGAARWLAGAVRTLQKRVEMLEAKDSFKIHADTSVSSHKIDDDVETNDTLVQVPRHKAVGDWKYDKVRRRPRRAAEWFAQPLPVKGCQLNEEILQCGPVADKFSMFGKVRGGNGDRDASSVRCRSRSQTLQDMYDNPVMGMSPMHGNDLDQTSTVSLARTRINDSVDANASFCVLRQKEVREFDISDSNPRVCSQNSAGELDCENLTECNRVETVIVRHVSFAENVEVVEFDPAVHATSSPVVEYNAPAPDTAYRAHAAPSPMVEYNAPLMTVHQAHAAPVPTVEYDAALMMAHQAHTTSAPMAEYDAAPTEEYDAYAERAAPSPLVDGQSSKLCLFLRCRQRRRQWRSRRFRLLRKLLIFLKPRRSNQFFMSWSWAVMI